VTGDAEMLAPFFTVFGAFENAVAAEPSGAAEIGVTIDVDSGTYDDGARRVPLAGGRLRPLHVYNLLYTTLVRAMDGVYLLHAAVVARADHAWVISAPSGSGKSSLGRALLGRGFELMSDDLAPVTAADGLVHPFPRRLGLVREEGDDGPDGALLLGDKAFVTPDQVGARVATRALRPGAVVLMNPFDPTGRRIEISIGLLGDGAAFRRGVDGCPGVRVLVERQSDEVHLIRLHLQGNEAIAAVERMLEEVEEEVLFQQRGYGEEKTYLREPVLTPISSREATLGLLREMLNREKESALMQRLGGRISAAFVELWGLLQGVPCYQLQPADIPTTADLLERTFGSAVQGDLHRAP